MVPNNFPTQPPAKLSSQQIAALGFAISPFKTPASHIAGDNQHYFIPTLCGADIQSNGVQNAADGVFSDLLGIGMLDTLLFASLTVNDECEFPEDFQEWTYHTDNLRDYGPNIGDHVANLVDIVLPGDTVTASFSQAPELQMQEPLFGWSRGLTRRAASSIGQGRTVSFSMGRNIPFSSGSVLVKPMTGMQPTWVSTARAQ